MLRSLRLVPSPPFSPFRRPHLKPRPRRRRIPTASQQPLPAQWTLFDHPPVLPEPVPVGRQYENYEMDSDLRKMADAANNTIVVYGHSTSQAKTAVKILIKNYKRILDNEPVSSGNCVLMFRCLAVVKRRIPSSSDFLAQSSEIFERLTALLTNWVDELDTASISWLLWAFGKIGRHLLRIQTKQISFPLLVSLLLERSVKLDGFQPKEVSLAISGLAWMQFKAQACDDAVEHLTCLALGSLDRMTPQSYASIIWGLGKLLYCPKNDFIKVSVEKIEPRVDDFTPQQISNVLWGITRLQATCRLGRLLSACERYLSRELQNFNEQALTIVLWSFAKLHLLPRKSTLIATDRAMREKLTVCSAQGIMQYIYACAIFHHAPSEDVIQLVVARVRLRKGFDAQGLCLCLWSLAILFKLDLDLFLATVLWIAEIDWKKELAKSEMQQLYQCMIHVQFFVAGGNHSMQKLPVEFIRDCQIAWDNGQELKWRDSVALSILVLLQESGYFTQSRHYVSKGLARYYVDLVKRPHLQQEIVLDVTIPRQRFRNAKQQVEGPRRWSLELFKKHRFQTLQVDAEEWRSLESDEKMPYLNKLIENLNETTNPSL